LYQETSEKAFFYPVIIMHKYVSDLDLCISHLVENGLRADNSFLETAEAVSNISKLVEISCGHRPTQDALALVMEEGGMPIRRQSITSMLYAAETLSPALTNQPFKDSLSRNNVDAIRGLRKALKSELSPEDFDLELLAYVNGFDEAVSLAMLKQHLSPEKVSASPAATPTNTRSSALRLSKLLGLTDVIRVRDDLVSGFTVDIPSEIESQDQAEAICFLVSLSGELGAGSEPAEAVSKLQDQLGLSPVDLFNLPAKIFCGADGDTFESMIGLIAEIRESNNQYPHQHAMEAS